MFGTELTKEKVYTFHEDVRAAVYTYHGCTLGVRGTPATEPYVAMQSPMHTYLNLHTALEQMRRKGDTDKLHGPRIMVAGPVDVGKSTLCKILINYAVRQGNTPIYVDIDIGQVSSSDGDFQLGVSTPRLLLPFVRRATCRFRAPWVL